MALNPATDKQPEPRAPLPPSDLDALIDTDVSSGAPQPSSHEPSTGPFDDAVVGAQEALDELGRFLTDAGGRFAEIDRLFAEATRPFGELATLLTEARATAQEANETRRLAGELEQELALRSAELDAVQRSLANEVKRCEQSDARAAEALDRAQRLETELLQERERAEELEDELAQAQVSIAASAEEANSERKRAEAARLEAEARRLEAEAARLEAGAADNNLEAPWSEHSGMALNVTTPRWSAEALDESDVAASEPDETAFESEDDLAAVQAEEERELEDGYETALGEDDEVGLEDDEAGLEDDEGIPREAEEESAARGAAEAPAVSPLVWTHSAKLALTAALADCEGPRRLLETAVRVLGSRGGWDVVLAWTLDTESQCWRCVAVWSSTHDETASLEVRLQQLRLSLDSPVARAAADGRLSWCGGPHAAAKAGLAVLDPGGLRSIVMLPLVDGAHPIAVMELCSRHEGRPADSLRRALEGIASEVAGTYVALEPEQEGPRWNRWLRR